MVHFDRKNYQTRVKNLGNKTEFCANCALGLINFARKSFALSGLFCAKCTSGVLCHLVNYQIVVICHLIKSYLSLCRILAITRRHLLKPMCDKNEIGFTKNSRSFEAALAQLGERQTEDLKAPCSIHGGGILL